VRITAGIMGTEVCLMVRMVLMRKRPATLGLIGPMTAATKMGVMMEVGIWEGIREGILVETRAGTRCGRSVRGLFRRWWIARISMLQRSGQRLVRERSV
jgi:hypothetical protein